MKKKLNLKIIATAAIIVLAFGVLGWSILAKDEPKNAIAQCGLSSTELGAFIHVPSGGFVKGANGVYPEEGLPMKINVRSFKIQTHEVTNSQFAEFVAATGYVTEAERNGGSASFVETETPENLNSWWRLDRGATWKSPGGEGTTIIGKELHPVVHVSLNDARAYASWAGGRIPNEVEWEYAASLGLFDPDNPTSGIEGPDGAPRANIWTGIFPVFNSERDGFAGTAPVGCFQKSLIGAYDMIGNVWEWTETRIGIGKPVFTIKGGSYLCGSNFCRRYRAAAREGMEYDFSAAHLGFRIAADNEETSGQH